jgi:SAM-dependent methyltransferase
MISFLKKLPIDLGQAEFKHDTAGKRIAFSYIPKNGQGKLALDIGCRDGYWSDRLKEFGYEVHSLDIDPLYSGAIKCDVEDGLPFDNNKFDLIWCTEVAEHLRKPGFLISEINRITKKDGGMSILTTPNSFFWLYSIVGLWGWTPKKLQNPDHKQFFNIKSIRSLFNGYDVYGYFPYALVFLKIKKLVGFLSPTFILIKKH